MKKKQAVWLAFFTYTNFLNYFKALALNIT